MPRVTVTMMIYNAARYLRQSIESVLAQTFTDFEFLLYDDASTDASAAIIQTYADPRMRLVQNTTNHGVAWSRQHALKLARGEYVAVLDADDLARPDRLQTQVAYLDQHPAISAVGSAYAVIDANGRAQFTLHAPTDPLTIRWKLLFGNCIGHSTVMLRRAFALAQGGYDASVFAGEDYDLWVRLATQGQMAQLAAPLTQWRWHAASLQSTEPLAVKDHFIWTMIKCIRAQTGLTVDFDVARVLYRGPTPPAANRALAERALATVVACLDQFLASPALITTERNQLRTLALEDIFLVALRNPGTLPAAWRAARRAQGNAGLSVLNRRILRRAGMALLPAWARRYVTRLAETQTERAA